MNTLAPLIGGRVRRAARLTVASFAAVPDDKVDYKPSETAKSPRELLLHVVEGNCLVGGCAGATIVAPEITDRTSLSQAVETTSTALADHLETLTDEDYARLVPFFGQDIPLAHVALSGEWHISRHWGQLDYLETIWGDLENHG